jgi:hypothetical protein
VAGCARAGGSAPAEARRMIWRGLCFLAFACAACQPPAMRPSLESDPVVPDASAPVAPPPPTAAATPKPRPTVAKDAATPALSSPNPIVDGGAAAPAPDATAAEPSGPPNTTEAALSQAGHAVLSCFGGDQEMARCSCASPWTPVARSRGWTS